ncbi:MAG TPA: HD domain-containing protein [Candidatus Methanomethylia archaeon]|nr:HD domain-containing protein [Candidatus Methanomethylicia archaeon]
MVVVSPKLLYMQVKEKKLAECLHLLESDLEVQRLLKMANVMAVSRLGYNDHGVQHSRIVAGSALKLLDLLEGVVAPSIVRDGLGSLEDAKVVVLCGAYLHDIGNAVHREDHELLGVCLAKPILEKILPQIYEDRSLIETLKTEILHCIYAHDEKKQALSVEAGVVKVADGVDMAEGRARIPYRLEKPDMHLYSALAVKKVELLRGREKPIKIKVTMTNYAGVFQVEYVLMRKLETSGLRDLVEIEYRAGRGSQRRH